VELLADAAEAREEARRLRLIAGEIGDAVIVEPLIARAEELEALATALETQVRSLTIRW
jgi:hypothetical protein